MSDLFLDTSFECEEQESEEECLAVEIPSERGGPQRGGRTRDEPDDDGTPLNVVIDPADPSVVAAPPCVVSQDTDELADIEGSLPAILDTSPTEASVEAPAEPSVEAEASVATSEDAEDAHGDEVSRIEGLGGIFGFGSR